MTSSIKNIATVLIHHFEGCSLKSYVLPHETWATIGWGHAIPLSEHPKAITQEQADALFKNDIDTRWDDMNHHITTLSQMTVGQCAAALSFRYNTKPDDFNNSTFVKDLNAGRFLVAGTELLRWTHGEGGHVLPGLVRRRKCENYIFNGGTIEALKKVNFFIT